MVRLSFQLLTLALILSGPWMCEARTMRIVNNCGFTVWPGTLSNAGQESLANGGFMLTAGAFQEVTAPVGWAGRFWGRTGCTFDAQNAGRCETGDCARGLFCNGAGGIPPATLAEFTLDGYASQDFYDVSLVDGYNLPLAIVPSGGSGACGSPGCTSDLNLNCPSPLQVVANGSSVVACRSACEAFQLDRYCCAGAFNSPALCGPSEYSQKFKEACPTAYSYAYDDGSSTFTCSNGAYDIVFCPGETSTGGVSSPAPFTSPGTAVSPQGSGLSPWYQASPPPPTTFTPPSFQGPSPNSPPLTTTFTPPGFTNPPQFTNPQNTNSGERLRWTWAPLLIFVAVSPLVLL